MVRADLDEVVSDFSRFYILTMLYEGPCHGYGIIDRFRSMVKKDISPSLVYPFLRGLERSGLVTHTVEPIGDKDRKVYQLTEEGNLIIRQLFKRFAGLVSTAIEPGLIVCTHCGCKVYAGGHKEVIDREERAFCCVHCAEAYKREERLEGKMPFRK